MKTKKLAAILLTLAMLAGLIGCGQSVPAGQTAEQAETAPKITAKTAADYAAQIDNATIDAAVCLDYSAGIAAGVYKWVRSEDGDYYTLAAVDSSGEPLKAEEKKINVGANNLERGDHPDGGKKPDGGFPGGDGPKGGMSFGGGGTVYQGVYMNANVTNLSNQTMAIYVPAAYLSVDADGNVTGIDLEAAVGNYTAETAPIVYLNECGGWKSSSPRSCDTSYIEQGMVYVTAGARSRDAVPLWFDVANPGYADFLRGCAG